MDPRPYHYAYPRPAVTTDVVVFTVLDERLKILLIRRGRAPFQGSWALPGGFLDLGEDLEQCAARKLYEETGVRDVYLEQLYTFGRPDRDPRERVISVAYFALVPAERLHLTAGDDAAAAEWFHIGALPPLAFDHAEIVARAHERLVAKLDYSTIAFKLLPDSFTLGELQAVYEILLDAALDKRNFRKWALALEQIEETRELCRRGSHRPARVYRLRARDPVEIPRGP